MDVWWIRVPRHCVERVCRPALSTSALICPKISTMLWHTSYTQWLGNRQCIIWKVSLEIYCLSRQLSTSLFCVDLISRAFALLEGALSTSLWSSGFDTRRLVLVCGVSYNNDTFYNIRVICEGMFKCVGKCYTMYLVDFVWPTLTFFPIRPYILKVSTLKKYVKKCIQCSVQYNVYLDLFIRLTTRRLVFDFGRVLK